MHPAHQVIVIVFFADAAEVRCKRAAHDAGAFANGMAAEAAARFQEFLAMHGVTWSLLRQGRPGERGLPDECGDRLHFLGLQAELRHLSRRTPLVGMLEPVRDPLFVDLHAHFFKVGADFLDLLEQVVRFLLELLLLRIHIADGDGQILRLLVKVIGDGIVRGRVAQLVEARDFVLIGLA